MIFFNFVHDAMSIEFTRFFKQKYLQLNVFFFTSFVHVHIDIEQIESSYRDHEIELIISLDFI